MNLYFYEYSKFGIDIVELGCRDGSFSVKIAPKEGNNMFSYRVKGNEFIYHDESLPLASFLTGNPILFPFPNRIEDAIWEWEEKKYIHKKNGVPRQLHSLVFDEKDWTYKTPIVENNEVRFETLLVVDENHSIYKGYPFEFSLKITYVLCCEGITLKYEVKNNSNKTMPYGFAIHPYFNKLSSNDKTYVKLPCTHYYETRDDVEQEYFCYNGKDFVMIPNILPTGNLKETKGSLADLNDFTPIGQRDLDHVFTSKAHNPDAVIDYRSKRIRFEISASEEFKHYVLYCPPDKDFFALEPQTCSTDAVNLYAKGHKDCNLLTVETQGIATGQIHFSHNLY